MPGPRIDDLLARLEKGRAKLQEILNGLSADQWEKVIYAEPEVWDLRALIAHFLSTEQEFLNAGVQALAGEGAAYARFDHHRFNSREQQRLKDQSPAQLMSALDGARQATLAWVAGLDEDQLEVSGIHPALGEINIESLVIAIYGHQLLHMREALPKLR